MILEDISRSAFLITSCVNIPLSGRRQFWKEKGLIRGDIYQSFDGKEIQFTPHGWYAVATINITTFNAAQSATPFNQSISGGIGLGYRFTEDFLMSLTLERTSIRQPRQFVLDKVGQSIEVNGQKVTSLSNDNNDYFHDLALTSISFKFVYILHKDPK